MVEVIDSIVAVVKTFIGFEGNVTSERYILDPRPNNSILPMSVDTTFHWLMKNIRIIISH